MTSAKNDQMQAHAPLLNAHCPIMLHQATLINAPSCPIDHIFIGWMSIILCDSVQFKLEISKIYHTIKWNNIFFFNIRFSFLFLLFQGCPTYPVIGAFSWRIIWAVKSWIRRTYTPVPLVGSATNTRVQETTTIQFQSVNRVCSDTLNYSEIIICKTHDLPFWLHINACASMLT